MIRTYAFHILKENMTRSSRAAKGATDRSEVGASIFSCQMFMEVVICSQVWKDGSGFYGKVYK